MKPLQLILATGTNEVETVLMDDILTSGHFLYIKRNFGKKPVRVAEWSALQTGKPGDSSSIPAQVKTFFSKESRVLISTLITVLN